MRSHSGSGRRQHRVVAGVVEGDDVAGHADHRGVGRHVGHDDRAGADAWRCSPTVMAPMSLAPAPTTTLFPSVGWRFVALGAGAAQGHALVEVAVVADLRRLADDDAHAVVDEEALADLGAGVDLDAGEEAADVRDEPGGQTQRRLR